jgi:hypothetical protein
MSIERGNIVCAFAKKKTSRVNSFGEDIIDRVKKRRNEVLETTRESPQVCGANDHRSNRHAPVLRTGPDHPIPHFLGCVCLRCGFAGRRNLAESCCPDRIWVDEEAEERIHPAASSQQGTYR